MITTPKQSSRAFTLAEVSFVIVVLLVLAVLALPFFARARARSPRIDCVNNQKNIGTAYRIWANEHGETVPSLQSVANGGWREFLSNANQGVISWTNYEIMRNEISNPKIVICPSDKRSPAANFTNKFGNDNVSYFVGVGANDFYPQSIAGGDRNLGPGPEPGSDYGYSPRTGKGNDVNIPINAASNSVLWSLKIHSAGYAAGAGNILLGDGSSQQCSSASFRVNWLRNADAPVPWPAGHVPSVPSIRLVFP
jgi:competence protein ComGC